MSNEMSMVEEKILQLAMELKYMQAKQEEAARELEYHLRVTEERFKGIHRAVQFIAGFLLLREVFGIPFKDVLALLTGGG